MGKEFEIRREVELPRTPDAVFQAVATGEGNASWLFPSEGGGTVVNSDAPHRFTVRAEGPDGWFNEVDFRIEAHGNGAILRYVHSGVFDAEGWDDQYDAVNSHTDFYLHTLGEYLEHFSPRTATYVGGGPGGLEGPAASNAPDGFAKLERALGVNGASTGDTIRLAHADVDGVVDYKTDHFLGVRTDDALYRFFGRNAFGGPVGMSIHHFGDGVDAEAAGRSWQNWLASVY